jgi:V8-like Glu-specific endopeptidase
VRNDSRTEEETDSLGGNYLKKSLKNALFLVLAIILVSSITGVRAINPQTNRSSDTPKIKITLADTELQETPPVDIPMQSVTQDDAPTPPLAQISASVTSGETGSIIGYNPQTGITSYEEPDLSALQEIAGLHTIEPFEGILPSTSNEGELERFGLPSDNTESVYSGYDDRIKISTTTDYPWRTICKIYTKWPGGGTSVGTGWFTDDFHVLTAGHVVYKSAYGGWYDTMTIIPAYDNRYAHYCHAQADYTWSSSTWTSSESHQYDWAFIRLDRSIGATCGWLGRQFAAYTDSIYTDALHGPGYPGDLDSGANMYYDSDSGHYADAQNHWYYIDTGGGQSGMPIYRIDSGSRYALTIHAYGIYGSHTSNHGTRLGGDTASGSGTTIFDWVNTKITDDAGNAPDDEPDLVDRGRRWSLQWDPVDPDYSERYGYFTPTDVGDGVTGFTVSTQVSNWGTDPSGSFNVKFYASINDYISSSDYLIGTVAVSSISSWQSATATWSGTFPGGVPTGTYYVGWIIDADSDVTELLETNNKGVITSYQLDVDATAPTWTQTPTNQVYEFGTSFRYNLNATDPSAIDTWWINDTTNFAIDTAGVITNALPLAVGVYGLQVSVNDTFDNTQTTTFTVTVEDTTSPTWAVTPTDQQLTGSQFLEYPLQAEDLSGIADWWIDDTTNFAIDSSGIVTSLGPLPYGVEYDLAVKAIDPYGNEVSGAFTVTCLFYFASPQFFGSLIAVIAVVVVVAVILLWFFRFRKRE